MEGHGLDGQSQPERAANSDTEGRGLHQGSEKAHKVHLLFNVKFTVFFLTKHIWKLHNYEKGIKTLMGGGKKLEFNGFKHPVVKIY